MEKKLEIETIFTTLHLNTEIGECLLTCSTDDLSVLFNIFRQSKLEIDAEIHFDFGEEENINPDKKMLIDFIEYVDKFKGHKSGIGLIHIDKYIRSKNK